MILSKIIEKLSNLSNLPLKEPTMLGEAERRAIMFQKRLIGTKKYCKCITRTNFLDKISR